MLYVGIDIAKTNHQIAIINHEGRVLEDNLIIQNNREDFNSFKNLLINF